MILQSWELNMNIKSIKAKITFCFCLLLVLLVFISYEGYFGPDKVLARNAQIDEMQSILQNELQARRYEKNMIIRRDVESKEKTIQYISEIRQQLQTLKQKPSMTKYQAEINDILNATNEYESLFSKLASIMLTGKSSDSDLSSLEPAMIATARNIGKISEKIINEEKIAMDEDLAYFHYKIIILSTIAVIIGIIFPLLISRSIFKSINEIIRVSQGVGEGNLMVKSKLTGSDEMARVANSIHKMTKKIGHAVHSITMTSTKISDSSMQFHSFSDRIASSVDDVAAQTTNLAAAGEEISTTANSIALNCNNAAKATQQASDTAKRGHDVIQNMTGIMDQILNTVQDSSQTVTNLGVRSDQIGSIVSTIDAIAAQTNLLALNAAIEAARAGEKGRGFAVVADEVRALAERTTHATQEISEMIQTIQNETKNAVKAMQIGVEQASMGTTEANRSGDALREIIAQVDEVVTQVDQIATATEQQTATTYELANNIHQIMTVLQQITEESYESVRRASGLNLLADELMHSLNEFKMDDDVLLSINKAKSAHMIFIGKIKSHLDGSAKLDVNKLPTHQTCAFGQWYHSCKHSHHEHLHGFKDIDVPHQQIHELAKQAIVAFDNGDKDKAKGLCSQMDETIQTLLNHLDKMGNAVQQA